MPEGDLQPGTGVYPIAYYINTPFPWVQRVLPGHIRTYYDCKGRPIQRENTWREYKWERPGIDGVSKITMHGSATLGVAESPGMMHDVRTLEMIVGGCCPPDLLLEFIASEEAPD